MTSRFFLPGAIAVSLHALVFFGFPRGVRSVVVMDDPPPLGRLTPLAMDDFQETPEQTSSSDTKPLGQPDAPRSRETFEPAPAPTAFQIPTMATTPSIERSASIIPSGPPGFPDGTSFSGPTIYTPNSLDHSPHTRSQARPAYPFEAKKTGLTGEVLVSFTVDEKGQVINPRVIRSSNPIFEEPSLRAVAKWRFEPGRKNGRAVRFQLAQPIQFSMSDS